MPIQAFVEQPSASDDKRGATRWRLRLEVPGSFDGEGAPVVIHDISTAGMLIETRSPLKIGQAIAVTLPEADDVAAHVVWQDEPLFGCRFDRQLPQAALSAAKLRSQIQDGGKPTDDAPEATTPEGLPERLRRLRRERGLSRAALSEQTGFSKPSIWAWESGKTKPRPANLIALAEVFGLTERQMLFGGEVSTPPKPQRDDIDGTASDLSAIIDAAKERIARTAAVPKTKVHIYIEF